MRVKCSTAISALEYEIEHSPNAKFSAQILHNNSLYSKYLSAQGSKNLHFCFQQNYARYN